MNNAAVYRKDYKATDYRVDTVNIGFDLALDRSTVACEFTVVRRKNAGRELVLYGREVQLDWIAVNGTRLSAGKDYTQAGEALTLHNLPDKATIHVATTAFPAQNTSLMGLYASGGNLFTQCEAEGFRRMTFFPDRPDVMAVYTVMLRAKPADFPVLLSNGNLLKSGKLPDGRHYALWHDPFKKPSYLFALVAGKLVANEARIKKADGTPALLQVWVRPEDLPATDWALESLKQSIVWDRKTYGRELDLDRFMIVAVTDFNMGAMENKGLNVFNTAYVLAQPETATDTDYANIEAVVGHEYFHNWTGNRITCQDWFQLTLKEGLTVLRDQDFSADQAARGLSAKAAASARAVLRIQDVKTLRAAQMLEDAGPMAHPIRPDGFEDISNFYTATVYEKGAEVIRMMKTVAGTAGFRRGMDTYFARYDGQAVTCDDFVRAIAAGSGLKLSQFTRWYEQAGTPTVRVSQHYDAAAQTFTLHFTQSNPAVGIEPKDTVKPPLVIPIALALLQDGKELAGSAQLFVLNKAQATLRFERISQAPVASVLRGFSAPVQLDFAQSLDELRVLASRDTDAFNRWDALQKLYSQAVLAQYHGDATQANDAAQAVFEALHIALNDNSLDNAYQALMLQCPPLAVLSIGLQGVDMPRLHAAREQLLNAIAKALKPLFIGLAQAANNVAAPYQYTAAAAAQRARRNAVLGFALRAGASSQLALQQYRAADNMTDRIGALNALLERAPDAAATQKCLRDFYNRFKDNALVIDKWFALQATQPHNTAADMTKLMQHPAFTLSNPNRARSVLGRYALGNLASFHAADGSGYVLWEAALAQWLRVNPEVAARFARALDSWQTHAEPQRSLMQAALRRASELPNLPPAVAEILRKALGA